MRLAGTLAGLALGLGAVGAMQPASAAFTGFVGVPSRVEGVNGNYRVMLVYATFSANNDQVLNLFDANISLTGSASPQFLQASDADSEIPPSFIPIGFNAPGEAWDVDSYVTIGAFQGNPINGTIADPDFDDSGAASGAGISGGGWYNLPPTNGLGVAGASRRVLVGHFAISEAQFSTDAKLRFGATIACTTNNQLAFATQSVEVRFALPEELGVFVQDDLDGDSKSDIVFYQPTGNHLFGWLVDGFALKQFALFSSAGPANSTLQGVGDIDANGRADVLWRNRTTGRFSVGVLDGLTYLRTDEFGHNPGAAWKCIAFTDISGDLKADIVFFNEAAGQVAVWLLDGASIASGGYLGALPGATPLGVGDLNGDGKRDILWRRSNGQIWGWLLDGTAAPVAARIGTSAIGTDWKVPVIADFDADGKDDLIWRSSSSGMVICWKMDGLLMSSFAILSQGVPVAWSIETAPDIDGNGRHEILWRNRATGQTALWLMNDCTSYGGGYFTAASGAWSVATASENLPR